MANHKRILFPHKLYYLKLKIINNSYLNVAKEYENFDQLFAMEVSVTWEVLESYLEVQKMTVYLLLGYPILLAHIQLGQVS